MRRKLAAPLATDETNGRRLFDKGERYLAPFLSLEPHAAELGLRP